MAKVAESPIGMSKPITGSAKNMKNSISKSGTARIISTVQATVDRTDGEGTKRNKPTRNPAIVPMAMDASAIWMVTSAPFRR
jgi:hypothetical protein